MLKKKKSSSTDGVKKRISIVGVLIFVFGAIIIGRLFFIQIINSDSYRTLAKGQTNSSSSDTLRGEIFLKEKDGNLRTAATQKDGFFLAIDPRILINPDEIHENLSPIIDLDKEDFLNRAGKKDDPFEVVAHRLNAEQAQEIREKAIMGVDVFPESWRFYPTQNLASHFLGFVGFYKNKLSGRYGLENYYEDVLNGSKSKVDNENFLEDIFSILSKSIFNPDQKGHSLVLTVEPSVQNFLENKLEKLQDLWQGKSAGGLIMDPKTGKILALAKKPDFNPNTYNEVDDLSAFVNPLVENIFEMGSVFKPLTLAAALNEGKIDEDTTYFDKGYVILDGVRIENFDGKGRGKVNIQEIFNQSLNTGAIFAMEELGKESFLDYIKKYGLDEKTGIDLPNEAKGNIRNLKSGRDIEYATASFGQGIAISPLELAVALSSLANGGNIVKPYLVESINISGGSDINFDPEIKRRVLDNQTSERITRMLVKTVDTALLGGTLKLKNYTVAAKTGTAQILNKEEGSYYEDRHFHSFFGYAPAFDARFLVFLYLEMPEGVRYASQSLGSSFMDTIRFLLNYYKIPPDR